MSSAGTPAADVIIDTDLVQGLLTDQHPDLALLPLHSPYEGWDNVVFRLGETLAVRLPRRAAAAALVEKEQTWLPRLQSVLTLPIPAPLRTGHATCYYPWSWSIIPWLPGEPADIYPPDAAAVHGFIAFLQALHQPAPPEAPVSPVRGVPLQQRAAVVEERLLRLKNKTALITGDIYYAWSAAVNTMIDTPRCWIHGDLHAANVLTVKGRIAGVIDWGDMASGDIATDLASIWILFPQQEARRLAMAAYTGITSRTWRRARGWAILFAAMLLDSGLINHARHAAMGENIFRHIAADLHDDSLQGNL
ncbi:phosphotransferase [Chitinophaga sp. Mgbs1]|uniref:Phosphotransferase n=1 Tax=Chitinophaga solisilvae TaxID=1233460 RepID=A0A3S1CYS5_9BACT|nr:phosphotransferase [Chitinophaga solisilvae]